MAGYRTQQLCWLFTGIAVVLGSSHGSGDDFKLNLAGSKKPGITLATTAHAVPDQADQFDLMVDIRVPAGSYIYGVEGDFGAKTVISIDGDLFESVTPEFKPAVAAKKEYNEDFKMDLYKHAGGATWVRRFRKKSGETEVLKGWLDGQYCSDEECIPIRKKTFEVSLVTLADPLPAALAEEKSADLMAPAAENSLSVTIRPTRPGGKMNPPKVDPITFTIDLTPAAKIGDEVTLRVHAVCTDNYHTYSLTQSDETGGGTPTTIILTQLAGLVPIGGGFVADQPFEKKVEDQRVLEIHEEVTWSRKFRVDAASYGAAGDISYQICNSKGCKPVKQIHFQLPEDLPAAAFNPVEAARPLAGSASPEAKPANQQGLIPFILTAVAAGYLALLTPCAFPMIPITVSFFLKQHEKNHRSILLLALVYCGSIILTFTVLGLGVAAIFGATQVNALANNPWVNIVISIVFFVFSLNMLGMFEIQIPSWLLTYTSSKEAVGGYFGAVFMALTFTLTSFTCTFAFVGTLLVSAANGGFLGPVVGMLAFGTAFASPFFFLALVPRLLHSLPKSGGWMNSVKVVLGLLELGLVVKFLSVADIGFNATPTVLDYTLVMLLWLVLSLAISGYLLGYIRFSHDSPLDYVPVPRALLAFAFLGQACLLAVAIINPNHKGGGWLMENIQAFAPPRFENDDHAGQADRDGSEWKIPGPSIAHHNLRFALDYDQAVAYAKAEQRPLFIDFTGVNCINCRLMEHRMAKPENRERLGQLVRAALYVDTIPQVATNLQAKMREQNQKIQTDWFGDATLPAYAITTPDGQIVLATFVGLETTPGEFTKFLDEGLAKFEAMKKKTASSISQSH